MLRDIDYFEKNLRSLDGFEDAAEYLRGIAKSKEVAKPEPPPAAPSPVEPEEKAEEKKAGEAEEQAEPVKESNGDTKPKSAEAGAALAAQAAGAVTA